MFEFEVFSGTEPDGLARWGAAWQRSQHREPSAHPAYASAFLGPEGTPACAWFRWDDGEAMFPFALRTIPTVSVPPARRAEKWLDARGTYGYSGAWTDSPSEPAARRFWGEFTRWCGDTNVLSVFTVLPLHPGSHLVPPRDVHLIGNNVVVDVARDDDDIWRSYEHKVRKNVKRARSRGLDIEIDVRAERLDEFVETYLSTMQRRSSADWFHFDPAVFRTFTQDLPSGGMTLVHAVANRRVVSTELVLRSRSRIYSFLGGTNADYYDSRPNDLLKHETIRWARSEGLAEYVLGGGPARDDGVFRYKRSFAPTGVVPLHALKLTPVPSVYREMCEARAERAATDFFPVYRAPTEP